MTPRDGHVRVLPLHVANKIAAGEVVERPSSVVKELVENSIDAGARSIRISVTQGGRKLVSVQDDGCGMSRDDAVLSLERQATSKILDVNDIEAIDTLGFRGEAIPSIASVSRFTITTRTRESDEGTLVQVNAGVLAEVRSAGCPPGTLVEVRDLFCNVPARRKFLRSYATEESHVKSVFTIHALAHPSIGFSLSVDGREAYRLAPAASLADRMRELFGPDFVADLLELDWPCTEDGAGSPVRVYGFIERPNLNTPTRHDQFIYVNGRPASAPAVAYALREAYPRRQGDVRPSVVLFIDLPPNQVDVNVHPTKREVRFRDGSAVKNAIVSAVSKALASASAPASSLHNLRPEAQPAPQPAPRPEPPQVRRPEPRPAPSQEPRHEASPAGVAPLPPAPPSLQPRADAQVFRPAPVQVEFAVDSSSTASKPWRWFKFLALTSSGFLLVETDAGIVTVNPRAARERIAYEALAKRGENGAAPRPASQTLLMPETATMGPADAARIRASLPVLESLGFAVEEFGRDSFKIDAVPQIIGDIQPAAILATIAQDLAESQSRRSGERWREELVAKSVARSFARSSSALTEIGAVKLVEDLASCRVPYVCPRGKPTMIFTSNRELDRKFSIG